MLIYDVKDEEVVRSRDGRGVVVVAVDLEERNGGWKYKQIII